MIDNKIKELRTITDNFLFIEYYSHTGCDMYKIKNEYTAYREAKLVLYPLEDGIETALDMAIAHLRKAKKDFEEQN